MTLHGPRSGAGDRNHTAFVSPPHQVSPNDSHVVMITISHSHTEGTRLTGTTRADGAAPVLKHHGWRWTTNTGWYLPRSRAHGVDHARVTATAAGLHQAGFTTRLDIDDAPPAVDDRETFLSSRSQTRAAALTARADKLAAKEQHLDEALEKLRDRMPIGQPILAGHHGANAVQRHHQEFTALVEEGITTHHQVNRLRTAAAAALSNARSRTAPPTVVNRIQRLQTAHAKATTLEQRQQLEEELAYWNQVRAGQITDGRALGLEPSEVNVGDQVRLGKNWYTVTRANQKTITVAVEPGRCSRIPYTSISEHRTSDAQSD